MKGNDVDDENTVDRDTGRTVVEKCLRDEICALKSANAELVQRLRMAYSALHVEQTAHEQTKATLLRLRKEGK